MTNAWTKRPLKWNCNLYQSVKSHIWKVACWLWHFSRPVYQSLLNPFWWRVFDTSEIDLPDFHQAENRNSWRNLNRPEKNGNCKTVLSTIWLRLNGISPDSNSRDREELINQLVPITVRSVLPQRRRKVIRCKRDLTLDVSYFKLRWLVNF